MSLISASIANLVNGVSQQPPALRLASQAEAQVNCFSSVVDGLKPRQPTEHVAKIVDGTLADAFMHLINRDTTERYECIFTADNIQVFDIDGTEKTVNFTDHIHVVQDAAVAIGDGLSQQVYLRSGVTTITLATSGTFVGTLVWEKSATGLFAGEESTVRTDTTATSATAAWTTGEYIRGRVSAWTSGTITGTITWTPANYLQCDTPSESLRAVSITDHTFIANATVTPAMEADLAPGNGNEGLIFVKAAQFTTTYGVYIDGVLEGEHTTASSGTLSTTTIAAALVADLTSNLGAGWTMVQNGASIHIVEDTGADFTLEAVDTRANTVLFGYKEKVQRFTDLPTTAPTGFTVEVIGDNESDFDNFYVVFEPLNTGGTFEEGVWVETVKPGIPYQLDASTMPHTLVRESDGTFTFGQPTWADRTVGDLLSSPDPSFIGGQIQGIHLFKNRLGFLSDENNVMSEASEFFNFFRTTVTLLKDSDPIDVAASHNKVSILRNGVPFNGGLLLFSDQTQFEFTGDGNLLTPKTASMSLMTEFESSRIADPVNAGKNVLFATKKGGYSGVLEYFVSPDTRGNDAADITSHIPAYIDGEVIKIATSVNQDIAVVLTDSRTYLFPYKYFWNGNSKLQSSWSKWSFNSATILAADFIDSVLYLLVQRTDGVHIEKIDITDGQTDPTATYLTHLDRRISDDDCTVAYSAITGRTTWTMPYEVHTGATYKVVTRYVVDSGVTEGVALQGVTYTGDTISATGDHSTTPVWIGEVYTRTYTFSRQFLKEKSPGGGEAAINQGRLQLLSWALTCSNSGAFDCSVTHNHRAEPSVYHFTGKTLGSPSNLIGSLSRESTTFRFPVLGKNDETVISITSDSHLGFFIQNAEWEADYTVRSGRLSNRAV